jgi:hypothetical protein
VIVCASQPELRDAVAAALANWREFELLAMVSDVAEALARAKTQHTTLVLVEQALLGPDLESSVAELAGGGSAVLVLVDRVAPPSVLDIPSAPHARVLCLPRWVLDRTDEVTAAHTRALFLDLCEMSAPPRSTREVEGVDDNDTDEEFGGKTRSFREG